jgi:hypothetical protein
MVPDDEGLPNCDCDAWYPRKVVTGVLGEKQKNFAFKAGMCMKIKG